MSTIFKRMIIYLDKIVANGAFIEWYNHKVQVNARRTVSSIFPYSLDVAYQKSQASYLNALCDKYGSDKGEISSIGHPYPWVSHTYADVYELLFQLRKEDVKSVIECGIGTNNSEYAYNMSESGKPGASLRVWRDFFPSAQIVGIDIDRGVLFEEPRIKTFYCDQTSSESIAEFASMAELRLKSVDIIIDDGLHEFHAGVSLFEGLINYVSDNGIYVIEDVTVKDSLKYLNYFERFLDRYQVRFVDCHRTLNSLEDNRLVIVTHAKH